MKLLNHDRPGFRALALVIPLVIAACGSSGGAPSTAEDHSPVSVVIAASPPPPGGPLPPQLRGYWRNVDSANALSYSKLRLTANSYSANQAIGSAVVNGDEIDFFAAPHCDSIDAVGRYRWTLNGDLLHFTALNDDPCERKAMFDNETYKLLQQLP